MMVVILMMVMMIYQTCCAPSGQFALGFSGFRHWLRLNTWRCWRPADSLCSSGRQPLLLQKLITVPLRREFSQPDANFAKR